MKTLDVEESLMSDEMTRMIAGGVYAADRLPRTIPDRPLLYIANPQFKPGRHWVVIYFGEEHIEYFDPLGKEPNSIIEDYLIADGTEWLSTKCKEGARDTKCQLWTILLILCLF